jgi:hypothetical protein
MLAAPAAAVTRRPSASPQVAPTTLATRANGIISSVIPGGCTKTKSRYGSTPSDSRTALPK